MQGVSTVAHCDLYIYTKKRKRQSDQRCMGCLITATSKEYTLEIIKVKGTKEIMNDQRIKEIACHVHPCQKDII